MTNYEFLEMELAGATFEDLLNAAGVTVDEFFQDMEEEELEEV